MLVHKLSLKANVSDTYSKAVIGGIIGNIYTKSDIDTKFSNLIDNAPDLLNTLHELAHALSGDPNFAISVQRKLDAKQNALSIGSVANNSVPMYNPMNTTIKNRLPADPIPITANADLTTLNVGLNTTTVATLKNKQNKLTSCNHFSCCCSDCSRSNRNVDCKQ